MIKSSSRTSWARKRKSSAASLRQQESRQLSVLDQPDLDLVVIVDDVCSGVTHTARTTRGRQLAAPPLCEGRRDVRGTVTVRLSCRLSVC